MSFAFRISRLAAAAVCGVAVPLDDRPGLHDPSTVIAENGKYDAAIVNAGGATDFCARFLDANDRPIEALTATLAGQ